MNSHKQLAVVTIFVALACAGLHAQSLDLQVTIPFDFEAGNKVMPAGQYQVHGQGPWIIVRAANGGRPATGIIMTNGTTSGDSNRKARLEFNRYGGAYFLAKVWAPYSGDGRELPRTTHEKELVKRLGAPAQTAAVLASNK